MTERGLLVVYTGDGKGKTTAALGLIVRALGWGQRVGVVQFIKGKRMTGERQYGQSLEQVAFHVMGQGFTWESDDISRDRQAARQAWERSKELIGSGDFPVVVLDELTYAIHYGWLDLPQVLEALAARPAHVSVVVTGRNAPQALIDAADLVTEMRAIKHPYTRGVMAIKGLDY